jgi:hypothetical protein
MPQMPEQEAGAAIVRVRDVSQEFGACIAVGRNLRKLRRPTRSRRLLDARHGLASFEACQESDFRYPLQVTPVSFDRLRYGLPSDEWIVVAIDVSPRS